MQPHLLYVRRGCFLSRRFTATSADAGSTPAFLLLDGSHFGVHQALAEEDVFPGPP